MRGFVPGLLLGALLGAGGVYAAYEKPWQGQAAQATADAGAEVAEAEAESKKKRPKGKKGRTRAGSSGPEGDDIPELTAADRALSWKGPAVALPPREMDFAGGEEVRPLNGSEINGVIKGQGKGVIDCIVEARGNAPLKAEITLEMLVDGSGEVKKVRMRAPAYLYDHGFEACARRAASRMSFPATGAHTVVTAPFTLTF
jgi:hypothetical protein